MPDQPKLAELNAVGEKHLHFLVWHIIRLKTGKNTILIFLEKMMDNNIPRSFKLG